MPGRDMISNQIKRLKGYQFSSVFLNWAATLLFLPVAIYLRFVVGTSRILDKNYPDYVRLVVFLAIVVSIWLGWKWFKDRKVVLTGVEPYLLIFLVAAGISTLLSVNPSLSLEKLIGLVSYVLFAYILLDIKGNDYFWQGIINSLLITAALSSIAILVSLKPYIEIYQISFRQLLVDPLYVYKAMPRLPYSLYLHPSVTAGYLVLILPLGFYQFSRTDNIPLRIIQGLGLVLNLVVIVLTESRGGLVGLGVMVVAAAYLFRERLIAFYKSHKLLVIIGLVFIVSIGTSFLLLMARSRGFSFTGWTVQARYHIWRASLSIIRDNPLFGSGLGTYGQQYLVYRDPSFDARSFIHAHNQTLQITVELGLVGLVSLIYVFWRYFIETRRSHKKIRSNDLFSLIALCGLFGVLLPDAIFTSAMIVFLFIFYLVWISPERDTTENYLGVPPLLILTLISFFIGLGAGWIAWKIKPYYQAVIHSYNKNWSESAVQLELALDRDPRNPYYQYAIGFTRGEIACNKGEGHSDSIKMYKAALESYPTWDIGLVNLAGITGDSGDYSSAISQMDQAIQTYPYNHLYHCIQGDYYSKINRPNEAFMEYVSCISNTPRILDSSYWREHVDRELLEKQIIQQILLIDPEEERDLLQESKIYYYSGDLETAYNLVTELVDTGASDIDVYRHFFLVMDQMGRLPEIHNLIEDRVHEYPDYHDLWYFLGRSLMSRDDYLNAEKALIINNHHIPSVTTGLTLGHLAIEVGDYERAESYYYQVLEFDAFSKHDFSRHVASRWPMRGVYNSCLPVFFSQTEYIKFYSQTEYIKPIMDSARDLEAENCLLAACLYNKVLELGSPDYEAEIRLKNLACFEDFDPDDCVASAE
jgi:O-antigen ligase/tetratricopeptide (TPR) repeat protein